MNMFSQKNLTVMFYNVENFFDYTDNPKTQDEEFLPASEKKWDHFKYQNKINRISQVIDSSVTGIDLPALVGFCEIENNQVIKDLISKSKLKSKPYESLCTTGLDSRGINVGLMYDKNIFDLIDSEELNAIYPVLPDNKTRNILYVTLKFKATEELIYVFVNHWPSRREGEKETEPRRMHAAKVVRTKIDELLKKNQEVKVIVMGDFNDTPKNKSVFNILKANGTPKAHLGELLNPYIIYENNGEGTHINNGEWHVFDSIILSGGFLLNKKLNYKTNNAFILKKDFLLFKDYNTGFIKPNRTYGGVKYFNGYSDHLAVYLKLDY